MLTATAPIRTHTNRRMASTGLNPPACSKKILDNDDVLTNGAHSRTGATAGALSACEKGKTAILQLSLRVFDGTYLRWW